MRIKLLPGYFKKIGLVIFFTGFIMGFLAGGINEFVEGWNAASWHEEKAQLVNSEADSPQRQQTNYGLSLPSGWTRFFDLCTFFGMLTYALSKEKKEDEFLHILRLESGWLSMVICLSILLLIYLFKGEIQIGASYVLSLPLILFLLLHHFRKKIIMED